MPRQLIKMLLVQKSSSCNRIEKLNILTLLFHNEDDEIEIYDSDIDIDLSTSQTVDALPHEGRVHWKGRDMVE